MKKEIHAGSLHPRKNHELFRKKQLRIVKKSMKLFIKKGYAETSMRDISKATGVDLSNLYNFISSKEEILFLVFDLLHGPAAELFEKYKISEIEDPEEQLRTAVHKSDVI